MENNYQEPQEVEDAAQGSPDSPDPSPGSPSPVFGIPEGDASIFLGFYSRRSSGFGKLDTVDRELRGTEDYVMAEPAISDKLKFFLKYTQGPQ